MEEIKMYKNKYGNVFETIEKATADEIRKDLEKAIEEFVDEFYYYEIDKQDIVNMFIDWEKGRGRLTGIID